VTQDGIFAYRAWLRKNQNGDRTVANKHGRLSSRLRFAGCVVAWRWSCCYICSMICAVVGVGVDVSTATSA